MYRQCDRSTQTKADRPNYKCQLLRCMITLATHIGGKTVGAAIWIHTDKRCMCSFGVNIHIQIKDLCAATTNLCGRISHHVGLMAPTYMYGCEHTWAQSGGSGTIYASTMPHDRSHFKSCQMTDPVQMNGIGHLTVFEMQPVLRYRSCIYGVRTSVCVHACAYTFRNLCTVHHNCYHTCRTGIECVRTA